MPGSPPGMVESRGEGQQHGIMGTRASFVSVPVCVNVCVNAGSLSLPLMPSETLWGSSCPGGSLLLQKATDGTTRKESVDFRLASSGSHQVPLVPQGSTNPRDCFNELPAHPILLRFEVVQPLDGMPVDGALYFGCSILTTAFLLQTEVQPSI